ncbi:vesicular integral-membrane protein VIP36-like isoform X1 [Petromyzon marinus]|uniref:Vesicular integral-membrane protein VIP36-like isoform X1 n=1 Tax=Petromyzon marinus TaxID=7757 RepID=A0AAJ7WTS5_PETMA|nr:vesicular integral-membrane protein VIP36-like isoform X1 [Petromyzon marinus]
MGPSLMQLLLLLLLRPCAGDPGELGEHYKREHSLVKPYQGAGSGSMALWDMAGSTMVTSQYVRLTPDQQSKQGALWNRVPCYLLDWELHVQFKVHGHGKKNLHGDGLALWYTMDRMQLGSVFGSRDFFRGLGIFIDTYANNLKDDTRVFPYISVMVNNGSLRYEHEKDGSSTEVAGCAAALRNVNHDTFLSVRYSAQRLTIKVDVDDKGEWRDCVDVPGVRLPTGYYFGASSATGDLSDNHDIVSMKVYELSVEHTLEEMQFDWSSVEPSAEFPHHARLSDEPSYRNEPLSGIKVFLLVFFGLIGIVICAVVAVIVLQKRQEQSRKRFY